MTIHIFNPEHDIALAYGRENFTPPHAARQLRNGLCFLPALWADDGDIILVDDAEFARKAMESHNLPMAKVTFFEPEPLRKILDNINDGAAIDIDVWGWDAAIRRQLLNAGVKEDCMPTAQQVETIRLLSHRQTAVNMIADIRRWAMEEALTDLSTLIVGEASIETSMDVILHRINIWKHIVLKAPWSSSGRGIRYVNGELTKSQRGWAENILRQQGSIIVEPYYNKVYDFGMEFYIDAEDNTNYAGLSLFSTEHGAYCGSIVDQEENKMEILSKYISEELIFAVRRKLQSLLSLRLAGKYQGPLGVDMMVVADEENNRFCLHPCVEINLRRTMGHVAIALTPSKDIPRKLMRITNNVNAELRLSYMENNFVMTV